MTDVRRSRSKEVPEPPKRQTDETDLQENCLRAGGFAAEFSRLQRENARLWHLLGVSVKEKRTESDSSPFKPSESHVLINDVAYIPQGSVVQLQNDLADLTNRYALMKKQVSEYRKAQDAWSAKYTVLKQKYKDAKQAQSRVHHRSFRDDDLVCTNEQGHLFSLQQRPLDPYIEPVLGIATASRASSCPSRIGVAMNLDSASRHLPQLLSKPPVTAASAQWHEEQCRELLAQEPAEDVQNKCRSESGADQSSRKSPWSQTTTSGSNTDDSPTLVMKQEELPSSPIVFVGSKSLKRKGQDNSNEHNDTLYRRRRLNGDGSAVKPFRVKEEPSSDAAVFSTKPRQTQDVESLDLDEVSGAIETPSRSRAPMYMAQDRASSLPPDVGSQEKYQRRVISHSHGATRSFNIPPADHVRSHHRKAEQDDSFRERPLHRKAPGQEPSVLQPVDPNVRGVSLNRAKRDAKAKVAKRNVNPSLQPRHTGILLSRGGKLPVTDDTTVKSLLETPLNLRAASSIQSAPQATRWPAVPPMQAPLSAKPLSLTPRMVDESSGLGLDFRNATRQAGPHLRFKPEHLLQPDDFVINQRMNGGVDFAFEETVRARELRRCLPGCTKLECCGNKFRDLIRIAGPMSTLGGNGQHLLWNDDTDPRGSLKTASERLLSEQLGIDAAQIQQLGQEEKQEKLVEARAAQMAQTLGRHREAHFRESTPPGYWDTEMANTQTQLQYRDAAQRARMEQVKERRQEALKPNGRWLFRDERSL